MTLPHSFAALAQQGLSGQRVFIRSDLNVPLTEDGQVSDDTRIRASLPAIQMALAAGAAVMVTSHLGRPTEGEVTAQDSLAPVVKVLAQLLGQPVRLISDWISKPFNLDSREVVVLENCRCNKGEKKNDTALAQKMASLCDIYVNDAFGTAHRAEATTEGIARFAPMACAGPLVLSEIDALTRALKIPAHPLVAIVAGSKVSTKLTILKSLAEKVDQLIVGGGIANTFLLASGHAIGKSLAEKDLLNEAREVMQIMAARGAKIPLPTDVVTAKNFAANAPARTISLDQVQDDDLILDIGPNSSAELDVIIQNAKTIVWNGPLGVFEFDAFANGTKRLAAAIAQSTGFSIAGGGDTVAAINQFGISDKVNYISTAGGAFLEFLEGKTLPAIAALEAAALRAKK